MTDSRPDPKLALLFDLDGTLVDTREANFLSYRDSLAEIGIDCKRSDFLHFFGHHWRHFLPILAKSSDISTLTRVHQRKQELYSRHLQTISVNRPLVTILRNARPSWSTGLVTTASRRNTRTILDHLGLTDTFDQIVTGDDVTSAKPSPDGYLLCLRRLCA